ncbi:hypothetical protein TNCV_3855071 [Trichonephila clavipes]|nr:hypothetical protein TNCV_3855071 [Trichonephila clavipes]
MIRAVRSSIVGNGVSHISDIERLQMKKYKGLRFGERESQAIRPSCLNYSRDHGCGYATQLKNMLVPHPTGTTSSSAQWSTLLAATLREVRNLRTGRFLQPYYRAPGPCIPIATFLVWLIVLLTATIIKIFTDQTWFATQCSIMICHYHAAYYHPSEFVRRIRQLPENLQVPTPHQHKNFEPRQIKRTSSSLLQWH